MLRDRPGFNLYQFQRRAILVLLIHGFPGSPTGLIFDYLHAETV